MDFFRTARAMTSSVCACTIMLLVVMLPAGPAFAQEGSGSASLELKLEIEKSDVILGEPVYATVRLINVDVAPVEVFKLLDPQTGALHIEVSSSSRPRFAFLPLFHTDAVHARTALAPGEEIAAAFPIFYGALGWTFDRPGTYRVTAEYRHRDRAHHQPIRSTATTVTVAGDEGIDSLLMTGMSASEEAGKFLLWQRGDQLHAGQALLKNVFKTYPDSPVADYALLALGRNLSRSFRNYAAGRIREADCESALNYFQKIRPDRLPAFLQIQQRLDEARCHIKLSQPAQARQSMMRANQMSAGRPEFRLLFQQAVRLEPALGNSADFTQSHEKPAS
ncbi:MAG: hypothetical protein K0S45_927 [Nitrospira sp.]|jgi:hypothetical protein|nr:hypothetical protein [Nitrospira sp.]